MTGVQTCALPISIINEHRNEKTYLKRVSVSVSGVWLSNCVAIGEGFSL